MMEYICKFCGKAKGDAKDWLLGFEGRGKTMKGAVTLLGNPTTSVIACCGHLPMLERPHELVDLLRRDTA